MLSVFCSHIHSFVLRNTPQSFPFKKPSLEEALHARYKSTKKMAQLVYQQKSVMRSLQEMKVEEMHLLEEMVQEVRGEEMTQEVRGEEMVQEVRGEEMVQEVRMEEVRGEEMVQEVRGEKEMEEMEMDEVEKMILRMKTKRKTRSLTRRRKRRRKRRSNRKCSKKNCIGST